MSAAAIAACRDYEHWAREIPRLTTAIGACRCPHERDADFGIAEVPSCFQQAREDAREEMYPEWPTLNDLAALVTDCTECSRLVELIRERRQARRRFGAAKRAVRRAGRALLAAEQPA
jgi:hypothetical protein